MGQYYQATILNKNWKNRKNPIKASLNSFDYDNGSKLMEHSYVGNDYVKAVETLLGKQYYGYPLVWIGDYADKINTNKLTDANLYCLSTNTIPLKIETAKERIIYRYIINVSKRLYIDIDEVVKNNKNGTLIIHPLPLLCAVGNGRGGGDYEGINMNFIGTWAYDRIGMSNNIPNRYKEMKITFKEEW